MCHRQEPLPFAHYHALYGRQKEQSGPSKAKMNGWSDSSVAYETTFSLFISFFSKG